MSLDVVSKLRALEIIALFIVWQEILLELRNIWQYSLVAMFIFSLGIKPDSRTWYPNNPNTFSGGKSSYPKFIQGIQVFAYSKSTYPNNPNYQNLIPKQPCSATDRRMCMENSEQWPAGGGIWESGQRGCPSLWVRSPMRQSPLRTSGGGCGRDLAEVDVGVRLLCLCSSSVSRTREVDGRRQPRYHEDKLSDEALTTQSIHLPQHDATAKMSSVCFLWFISGSSGLPKPEPDFSGIKFCGQVSGIITETGISITQITWPDFCINPNTQPEFVEPKDGFRGVGPLILRTSHANRI
jgi:hypothetical protein